MLKDNYLNYKAKKLQVKEINNNCIEFFKNKILECSEFDKILYNYAIEVLTALNHQL